MSNNSRNIILDAISKNQPTYVDLPALSFTSTENIDLKQAFENKLNSIGGKVISINSLADVRTYIIENLDANSRIISSIVEIGDIAELITPETRLHYPLENIEHAIIEGQIGVAENSAIWVTERLIIDRVLPFICQHLYIVLKANSIVELMHEAYEKIDNDNYGFGTFIAGPSKTADIEQSLVIGAHGARSLIVFLLI